MIAFLPTKILLSVAFFSGFFAFSQRTFSQDVPIEKQKYIFFPHTMNKKWNTSIGVTAVTFPYDITEEFRARIPAGDIHVLRKLGNNVHLHGNLSFQLLQNLVSVGPQWTGKLNDRLFVGAGDQIGYWFGFVNFAGFKSRGSGWQNAPNVSVGYRFNRQVLLTIKADALMNFNVRTYAGKERVASDYNLFSGSSYTIAVEQPFYGNKNLVLGFRALYTDFFWQTWPAFESFDRNSFFPQIIIGVIL